MELVKKKNSLNRTCLFTLQIITVHMIHFIDSYKCKISCALNRVV